MRQEEKVIKYYVLTNRLKKLIRSGWKSWKIDNDRLESVAEHVYGVIQLAIAMYQEYKYDIDLEKVILMLAIHETEEIFIGDLTLFEISNEEKCILGHKKVHEIFDGLLDSDYLENLILEFDERKTKEAKFAYQCDKLECDIQARLYDLEGCINYRTDGKLDEIHKKDNKAMDHPLVKDLLDSGMNFSEMWLTFDQKMYNYDDAFNNVSEYAKMHDISYKKEKR